MGRPPRRLRTSPSPGSPIPAPVVHWLGRIKAAAARVNAELGLLDADIAERIAAAGDAVAAGEHDDQFPVDVFQTGSGHLLEHERERGDRQPCRRGRPRERPREHGPVVQRRLSVGRPPRGARRGRPSDLLPALDELAAVARGEGRRVRRRRQGRPHPPDGRGARHPRPGVRRLRGPDPARRRARARYARPRRPDPARRHRDRDRASTPMPSSPTGCARCSPHQTGLDISAPADRVRGAGEPRRAGRALGCAQGRRRVDDQDRQRPRADGLGPARRPRRDPPARAPEGLVDHARQGQPGDLRGRDPGRRPGDRQRRRDHRSPAPRASSSSTFGCR